MEPILLQLRECLYRLSRAIDRMPVDEYGVESQAYIDVSIAHSVLLQQIRNLEELS